MEQEKLVNSGLTYPEAVDYLKTGLVAKRANWESAFIYQVEATNVAKKLLRGNCKKQLERLAGENPSPVMIETHIDMYFEKEAISTSQIMIDDNGNIVKPPSKKGYIKCGWIPSEEDKLANDWEII